MDQSEIVDLILKTINTIFSNILSSIDNNIYLNLDNIVFIDSDILSNSFMQKLLGSNGKSGFLYLADAMLLGISLFYLIKYFYSNVVDASIEKPSQFIFKLIIFALLVNFSYFIFQQILSINYFITSSIQEIGKDVVGFNINFSELITVLNKKISFNSEDLNLFSFDGIIKSFVSIGLLNLLFTYSIRFILLQILILFSPFAILSLITNSTSWIFNSWLKGLFSLIVIQLFVAIVIIVIFCIDYNNKILFIGGIYALTSINNYVRELFGGFSIQVSNNLNSMISLLKK